MNAECLAQKVYTCMCIWNLQVDIQQSFLKKKKTKRQKNETKKNQIWISLIDCEYNFSNFLLVNI